MSKDYVPGKNGAFRSWINSLFTFVSTNAALWGLPIALVTQFDTMRIQFLALFDTVENKRTRTTEQVLTYESYKAEFTTFLRDLVQVHLVRNAAIPYATKISMNLNPRMNGSERPSIDSTPIIVLTNKARGVIKFSLQVLDMGKRAKIHPNANGAELRFYITVVPQQVHPAGPQTPSNTGGSTPASQADPTAGPIPAPTTDVVMETIYSTRGTFDRKVEDYLGKAFVVQARWINTTDASKNSTWSDFVTIIIS